MNADVQKTCARCGRQYWWTVEEQEDCVDRGVMPLRRCPNCRTAREQAPDVKMQALIRREPQSVAMSFPQLEQPLITDDIRRLLNEASAPIIDRSQTFTEWWNGVDVRREQLKEKLRAGRAANALIEQRAEFLASVIEIAKRADTFERERIEAHLAKLELEHRIAERTAAFQRERLESHLAELELQDRIAERNALREVRLATHIAVEGRKNRKLLEPEAPPPPVVPERERIIKEHRQNLQAKATVRRQVLGDLESEVSEILNSRVSGEQKVAEIRAVLEVFGQDESILPRRARYFLRFMDSEDDDD